MAGLWILVVSVVMTAWTIQLITGTTCQGGRFGDTCSYSCHCSPPCNQATGVCNGACDPGWLGGNGQTCQRGNVAYSKTATSSPTDYADKGWTADKVVDGNRDQDVNHNSCFHSAFKNSTAVWTVDLGQQYRIHDVRIYNRVGYPHLVRTAVLSLSNCSSSTPGVTCYTFPSDTAETDNSVYDVTCDGTGRYFTITHSMKLILCEVEIYVCSNGNYGRQCSNSCIERRCAGDSQCDHVRGTCISGCEAGWIGEDCRQACSIGSYGQNCSNSCTDRRCTGDSPCDHIRGTCVSGCEPGWMGEDCREACSSGSYGQNCSKTCTDRQCAGDSPCDHVRGTCVSGCEPGSMGEDCREEECNGCNASQLVVAVTVTFVAGVALGVIVGVDVWRRRNRRLHKTSELHPANVSNAQTERSQASDDVGSETRTYDSLNAASYDAKIKGETYCTIKSGKTDLGTDATVLTCDVSDSIGARTYEPLDNTSRGTDGEYSEIRKL
ncbi:protein draper-like isoform X1 [Haliotis rufescens]|uniref:protein draper-like isoform X1 n=1 Tax=Haliotis rufescens TaxID=6454 RepID=UPI00201F4B39|nr:protein draper-like isoform X1 [Haliotis rufescens]